MTYVFDDDYELDLQRYELRYAGKLVRLEPQVFNVLVYLVQHRDRVVSKEELLEQLWPGRFVGESVLTSRLMAARKAVGDSGQQQRIIQTLRRVGLTVHQGRQRSSMRPRRPPPARPALSRARGG